MDERRLDGRMVEYATASEVEVLLSKLAAIADLSGVSPQESTGGSTHSRKRLAVGHARALLARSKVTVTVSSQKQGDGCFEIILRAFPSRRASPASFAQEARSLHGLASAIIEKLMPGHPLGPKKKSADNQQASGSMSEL